MAAPDNVDSEWFWPARRLAHCLLAFARAIVIVVEQRRKPSSSARPRRGAGCRPFRLVREQLSVDARQSVATATAAFLWKFSARRRRQVVAGASESGCGNRDCRADSVIPIDLLVFFVPLF